MSVLRIAFLSSAVLEFFAALGVAGVALYVGLSYLDMIAVPGTTMALQAGLFCLLMAPEVYQPLRQFAAHYHDGEAAKAAVTVIAQTFDELPELGTDTGSLRGEESRDRHQFREVADQSARRIAGPETGVCPYFPASTLEVRGLDIVRMLRTAPDHASAELVLQDLRFALRRGEHVALVGESGAGKSTLIEALAGLGSSPTRILLDGIALADWTNAPLRRRVAVLGQRAHLFHGSIADNIRLGLRDATDEEVLTAARLACVTDFALRLPDGLGTRIGTRGHGLSGGERQRVALARIFLRDPGLILLDEPTASLDADTEARVLDAILAFADGRTLLVATHSDAVARRMQRTLRISDKRVVQGEPSAPLPAALAVAGIES